MPAVILRHRGCPNTIFYLCFKFQPFRMSGGLRGKHSLPIPQNSRARWSRREDGMSEKTRMFLATGFALLFMGIGAVALHAGLNVSLRKLGYRTWSGGDCRAFLRNSDSYCTSGDCRAILRNSDSYCDTNDCRAIIRNSDSYCSGDDCRAMIRGSDSYCKTGDCRAILRRSDSYCDSKSCRAFLRGSDSYCP